VDPTLLFVVEDAFQITGRGCVLVPGPVAEAGGPVVRVGDPIRLVKPDGQSIDTTVRGIEMIGRRPRPAVITAPILLPREITKDQVPPGTHVLSLANHTVASEVARRSKFTDSEYERGHAAYGEFKAKGHTELTCLRCGNGHFRFLEHNNSLEIRCETPNCLVERIRGI